MPILEDENRTLRNRIQTLESELRHIKEIHTYLTEENAQLKERLRNLIARQTPGAEGRAHPRVQSSFRVDSMNSKGDTAMGMARDVSLGGAFIETDMHLIPGESMTIAFELGNQPFKVHAEVVRVTETGFGVKFSMEPRQQDMLKQCIIRL